MIIDDPYHRAVWYNILSLINDLFLFYLSLLYYLLFVTYIYYSFIILLLSLLSIFFYYSYLYYIEGEMVLICHSSIEKERESKTIYQ